LGQVPDLFPGRARQHDERGDDERHLHGEQHREGDLQALGKIPELVEAVHSAIKTSTSGDMAEVRTSAPTSSETTLATTLDGMIENTIARDLGVDQAHGATAVKLLDEGNTVPFIARYRKEATGGLDDGQPRTTEERLTYLREREDR